MSNTLFKKAVASAAALSVVLSIVSPVVGVNAADVSVDAANRLATLGIINNNSENPSAYRLNDSITRWEMAKVMLNLAGEEPNTTCEGKFSDVSAKAPNDWVCGYVEKGLELGFLSANSKFRPNDSITEAETLKMVMEALGVGLDAYDAKTWVADLTSAAVEAWVISETTTVSGLAAAKRSFVFTTSDAWVTATDGEGAATDGDLGDLGDLFGDLFGDGTGSGATSTGTTSTGTTSTGSDTSVKSGSLEITLNPTSPVSQDVPENVSRVAFVVADVTAGKSDVSINSIDLESLGFGDSKNLDNVAVYYNGLKISRERNVVDSKVTLDMSPAFVVKAGETAKLTISAKIDSASTNGDSYGFKIVWINSTAANLKGLPLVGNTMKSIVNTNLGIVDFTNNKTSAASDIKVGEDKILGSFKLALNNDKEDVRFASLKVKFDGTAKADSLSNLRLFKDWVEIAKTPVREGNFFTFVLSDVKFPYNISKTSTFDIKGTVTSDVGYTVKFLVEKTSDLYLVGEKYGFTTAVNTIADDEALSNSITIKGSKVDVSYTEWDKDTVKKDTKAFDFGTLKLKSQWGNYLLETYKVKVTYTAGSWAVGVKALKNLKLGGVTYDSATTESTGMTTQYFTFKDIAIPAGSEKNLSVTADIDRTASNGDSYTVDVSFVDSNFKLKDEDNNKSYTLVSEVNGILSTTTGLDSKKVNVELASLSQTRTVANGFSAVVGSTVTAYKWELKASTAGDVKVTKVVISTGSTHTAGNLNDILSDAKLVIGSDTYNYTSLDAGSITFDGLSKVITAGSTNKQSFELVVTLKDSSSTSGDLALKVTTVTAEDNSDGSNASATPDSNVYAAITTTTKGTLTVEFDLSKDQTNLTDINKTVKAGSTDVVVAKLKLKAEKENVKVIDAYFSATEDLRASFKNFRLVDSNKAVIANGTVSDAGTYVEFKGITSDKGTFVKDAVTYAYIIADTKASSQAADDTAISGSGAKLTFLHATNTPWKVEGVSSKKDVTDGNKTTSTWTNLEVAGNLKFVDTDSVANFGVSTKNTKVVYSDVALVELEKVAITLTTGNQLIAKLKLNVTNSNKNKTTNNDIKAKLASVKLGFGTSFSSGTLSNVTFTIKKGSYSTGTTVTSGSGTFTLDTTDSATEVDGQTYFEVYANIANGVTFSDSSSITTTIEAVDSDVVFTDETTTFGKVIPTDLTNRSSVSTR